MLEDVGITLDLLLSASAAIGIIIDLLLYGTAEMLMYGNSLLPDLILSSIFAHMAISIWISLRRRRRLTRCDRAFMAFGSLLSLFIACVASNIILQGIHLAA